MPRLSAVAIRWTAGPQLPPDKESGMTVDSILAIASALLAIAKIVLPLIF
ncbi:hypothetical protein QT969_10515 [Rhodococcus sp. CSLK01-03]|uniref:Uncharacterized protein n=1 Tax=Rhodococcus indonesiensis TaxID=3055869 RepID=A0ABT7RM58_9NOCA|nr:hypothetical protein [Rhodococcus indonesiensis]MDM7488724.1 hypothetical protein [Rhodococcus indonesiensis]